MPLVVVVNSCDPDTLTIFFLQSVSTQLLFNIGKRILSDIFERKNGDVPQVIGHNTFTISHRKCFYIVQEKLNMINTWK